VRERIAEEMLDCYYRRYASQGQTMKKNGPMGSEGDIFDICYENTAEKSKEIPV
jgi:hypothetical protein